MARGRRKLRFSKIYTFSCGKLSFSDEHSQVGGPGFSRQVFVNDPDCFEAKALNYGNNNVSTTKYDLLTFIPKSLFEQFRRVANIYFLVSACLSYTSLAPFSSVSFILPLLVVIGATMVKEAIEDWRRFQQDNEVNNRKVELHRRDGNFDFIEWRRLRVGDIVKVKKDNFFPTDLLLLSSSYEDGICYVETMNLDGETNLKLKQAIGVTSGFQDASKFKSFTAVVNCEDPNSSLYKFVGTMNYEEEQYPLSTQQLLLRDSKLRNTDFIYGAVIFTGHDTKVMRNATDPPSKRSGIEKKMDRIIYFLLSVLVIISSIGSIFFGAFTDEDIDDGRLKRWYLRPDNTTKYFDSGNVAAASFFHFLSAMILYGYFIPISLYVSIEIVKILQSIFINQDIKMYYEDTDKPARARTSNLNEELGQVHTVLSDKTGTLTSNSMEFVKCSIAGTAYGNEITDFERTTCKSKETPLLQDLEPDHEHYDTDGNGDTSPAIKGFNFKDERIRDGNWVNEPHLGVIQMFFRVLSICHTAIPEVDEDSGITSYEAESPDEAAFVIAGRELGFKFSKRTQTSITVVELDPALQKKVERSYELLNILEFNSSRRRMSVVVRSEEGKLLLLSKGADSVMLERLAENGKMFEEKTKDHINEYADAGLRTLVLAYRELDEEEYSNFNTIFTEARNSVRDREENIYAAAELIEKDLILLGATAVEDKLQKGVPECIDKLVQAGIKIWVLTGDKMETAINIGFACSLLRQGMKQIIITLETPEIKAQEKEGDKEAVIVASKASIADQINDGRKAISSGGSEVFALIIDGKSLEFALGDDLKEMFLALATSCASVICCRSSPKQKALVTRLVKTGTRKTTLAIGDGANDVGMLQEADIGIGISGVEGMQAVMASDVAIAQFRFLERLLLVHGHWCYRRISSMVCYFFYKNVAFGFTLFLFEAYASFSAQPAYNEWFLALYNVFFTSLPVIALGVFDQDVSARYCLEFPLLYEEGIQNLLFGWERILGWMFNGALSAVTIFFFCTNAIENQAFTATGEIVDFEILGVTMYTCVVWVVNCQLALFVRYFTMVQLVFIWVGIALWYIFLLAYGSIKSTISTTGFMVFIEECAPAASYWILTLFVVIATLVPYFAYSVIQMWFWPMHHEKIQRFRSTKQVEDLEFNSSVHQMSVKHTTVERSARMEAKENQVTYRVNDAVRLSR